MILTLVTAPAEEPVSVDEVRAMLPAVADLDDGPLQVMIKAAREAIDGASGWLGRSLVTQTWDCLLPCFPACPFRLPYPPIQQVVSIVYKDSDGTALTLAPTRYRLIGADRAVLVAEAEGWPATSWGLDAVTIRCIAGYGAAAAVPAPIRQAVILGIAAQHTLMARDLRTSRERVDGVDDVQYSVSDSADRALTSAQQALLAPYQVLL